MVKPEEEVLLADPPAKLYHKELYDNPLPTPLNFHLVTAALKILRSNRHDDLSTENYNSQDYPIPNLHNCFLRNYWLPYFVLY